GPSRQGLVTRGLPVAVQQSVPIGLPEAIARQRIGNLLERAPQAHQIAVTPESRPAQLALVEVDDVHLGILVEKDVVRVEIGVTHPEIMESPDATADRDPSQDGEGAGREAFRERADRVETLGNDVATVREA